MYKCFSNQTLEFREWNELPYHVWHSLFFIWFLYFFPPDLFKIVIYSGFCKAKIQMSLFLKWSAFFSTIISVLSNFKIKIRADISHSVLLGDLLSLFLVSGNLLLIVNHNYLLLVFQRSLQVLPSGSLLTSPLLASFWSSTLKFKACTGQSHGALILVGS